MDLIADPGRNRRFNVRAVLGLTKKVRSAVAGAPFLDRHARGESGQDSPQAQADSQH